VECIRARRVVDQVDRYVPPNRACNNDGQHIELVIIPSLLRVWRDSILGALDSDSISLFS
jgi:hypothetical protein